MHPKAIQAGIFDKRSTKSAHFLHRLYEKVTPAGISQNDFKIANNFKGDFTMLINFNELQERTAPGMNNGTGEMSAKMYMSDRGKIIPCRIHPGGSIGVHRHDTSDDINYVLSGSGKAICNGVAELLTAGCCHICQKGSEHSIINTGNEDLCLLTVVVER